MAAVTKRSARQIWNDNGTIHVGPTSRGTWTVIASRAKNEGNVRRDWERRHLHHLALEDVPEAVFQALEFLRSG